MKNTVGMTIMEVMVTIIIVSIIAAFGLVNFDKAMDRNLERNAAVNIAALHGAVKIYEAKNGGIYPTDLTGFAAINTAFNINVVDDGVTYYYNYITATTWEVIADSADPNWTITAAQGSLEQGVNPCCSGACMLTWGC